MEVTVIIGMFASAIVTLSGSVAYMYRKQIEILKERIKEKEEEIGKKDKEITKHQSRERETIDGLRHLIKENTSITESTLHVLNALYDITRK